MLTILLRTSLFLPILICNSKKELITYHISHNRNYSSIQLLGYYFNFHLYNCPGDMTSISTNTIGSLTVGVFAVGRGL